MTFPSNDEYNDITKYNTEPATVHHDTNNKKYVRSLMLLEALEGTELYLAVSHDDIHPSIIASSIRRVNRAAKERTKQRNYATEKEV